MRYETEDPQEKTRAQVNLIKVKAQDEKEQRIHELRISPTLSIIVTKKNFNREYAQEYAKKIKRSQSYLKGRQ